MKFIIFIYFINKKQFLIFLFYNIEYDAYCACAAFNVLYIVYWILRLDELDTL